MFQQITNNTNVIDTVDTTVHMVRTSDRISIQLSNDYESSARTTQTGLWAGQFVFFVNRRKNQWRLSEKQY